MCHGVARWKRRQEGSVVGNSERLRERRKALKSESRKRIRYETGPADVRAEENVKRLRKPEDVGGEPLEKFTDKPLPVMGKRYWEKNLAEGSCWNK